MSCLSVRPAAAGEQRYFAQYLLPQTAQELRRSGGAYTLLGALTGPLACGASAVRWTGGEAVLESLFIDPLVRGRGLGGALADLAILTARERDAGSLTCGYVLAGEDLVAMNAIFSRRGGAPRLLGPAYCADVSACRGARLIGAALRGDYRPAPAVVPFSRLTPEQLARLEERPDIPSYLRWQSCEPRCDRELSLAWVQAGQVSAYILGGEAADGGYLLAAAWRGAEAPAASFLALLRGQLNRCWYQAGGGFPYYFSAVTAPAQALARLLLQGHFQEYAQMSARISL